MQKIFLALCCALVAGFNQGALASASDEKNNHQICQAIMAVAAGDSAQRHLLSTMRIKHPRLIVLPENIVRLKKTIKEDQFAKRLFGVLRERADEILIAPKPKHGDNDGQALTTSRLALKHITMLAGMFRLTGDKKYASHARDEMLEIANFSDWGPTKFLCVAEMTAAMAIGYDWLYDELSVDERLTICRGIIKNGLEPGLNQYRSGAWWSTAAINWNVVCNGGLLVGALAVADDEPQLSEKIIDCALLSMPIASKTFAPDGGWPEGPGYWAYGTRYLVYALASLRTALGTDFDLSKSPGIADTGFFRIYSEGPTGKSFNFADSDTEVPRGAQMFWLSHRFKQPVFAGAELHIAEILPEMFHLLFYRAEHVTPAQANLALNKIFMGTNIAFFRSSWTDDLSLYAGFKGGDNFWSHSHLDLGSFVLDASGYRWAEDLGPDDYELPGYFKDQRFSYYRLQTQSHNTLTVANENQAKDAQAKIVRSSADEYNPYAVVNLQQAYPGQFVSLERGMAMEAGKKLIVQDEFQPLTSNKPLIWHFHTKATVTILDGGRKALLEQGKGATTAHLYAEIISCPGVKFTVSKIESPREQAQQPDVSDLTIKIDQPDPELLTRLIVTFSADEKSFTPVKALSQW